MAGRLRLPPAAALALVVLAAHGLGAWALGFYNDDYAWLKALADSGARTPGDAARALWAAHAADFAARPAGLLWFPALFAAFGTHALPYQLVYLLLDFAVVWGLYRLLVEYEVKEGMALLAALFAALYPSHDATHHWMTNSASTLALAGVLTALRLSNRGARPAAALVYSLSALLYESAALLILLPIIFRAVEIRRRGRSSVVSAVLAAPELLIAGLFVIFYQRAFIPAFMGLERHPMSLSFGHAFVVFRNGFECSLFNRLTHLIWRSFDWATTHFSASDRLLFLISSVVVYLSFRSVNRTDNERPPSSLLVFGAAFFFLGYLPYVFDASYVPEMFTPNNRLNLVPALGASCLLAWACFRWPQSRRVLPVVLAAFLLADRVSVAQWTRASARQNEILDALAPLMGEACASGGNILLTGFEERVGSATVFESVYDFDGALRLRRACPGLHGWVGQGRVRHEKGGVVLTWFQEFPLSYDRLFSYDVRSGRLARVKAGDRL